MYVYVHFLPVWENPEQRWIRLKRRTPRGSEKWRWCQIGKFRKQRRPTESVTTGEKHPFSAAEGVYGSATTTGAEYLLRCVEGLGIV
jgi:hypothetical protein